MARRYTIELLMNLAKSIGANPQKFMGTRTNISFLGKGPTKNPLFQSPVAGLETATEAQLGSKESIIGAVEDAMGFASANKLNSIQIQALGLNMENILKVYKPPVLPSATVTDIAPGIAGLKRFPKESHKFFGRPLKTKDFDEIDRLMKEGYADTRGRRWDFKPKTIQGGKEWTDKAGQKWIRDEKGRPIQITEGLGKYRLWKAAADVKRSRLPGPGNLQGALDAKTGMSRAIARQILQQDTRLKLKPEELFMLKEGKGEPLDLMRKYYGNSMMNLDAFLNEAAFRNFSNAEEAAATALKEIELIPQFASGGLARILEV